MPEPTTLLVAVAVLAVGTAALRVGGVVLAGRITLPVWAEAEVDRATVVLLCALIAVATLFDGSESAGPARIVGVCLAGAMALARVPFVLVVVGAAASTALLRALGMP